MALTIASSQFLLTSCGNTDKVIISKSFQKRKFNKGYYVNLNLKNEDKKTSADVTKNSPKESDGLGKDEWLTVEKNMKEEKIVSQIFKLIKM